MTVVTHIGIDPDTLNHVLNLFPGRVSTDVDSWHVWGEPINSTHSFGTNDFLHVIIDGDVRDELEEFVKTNRLTLREMASEGGIDTGILAVVTDQQVFEDVVGTLWDHDITPETKPTPFVDRVKMYADMDYFYPDTLDPVTNDDLLEMLAPFIDNLLESRVIIRREDAEDLAERWDNEQV